MTTQSEQSEIDVLIVGAGPTGMALALALAKIGIRFLIVDKQAEGANTSRAAVIHARTLEVLEPLGLTEALLREGVKVPTFRVRDRDRVLLDIGFAHLDTAYPFTLMCPQHVTERLLLAQLHAVGVEIVRPAELVSMREDDRSVEVEFLDGGVSRSVRAKWVVGCDGGHSFVRHAAGIAFEGDAYAEDFVLADVAMEWPLSLEEIDLFYSAEGLLVVAPMPHDRFRLVATVPAAPETLSLEWLQQLVARRGPAQSPGVVREVYWTSQFRLQHRTAESVYKGRILLCGDAAHVHSPAGGQGMNTGIQDAVSLAAPLADALDTGATAGLESWAERRREIARSVVAMTDRMTRAATLESTPLRLLRNAALTIVGHLPGVPEALARSLSELDNR